MYGMAGGRTVVAGVDGSEESMRAALWAATEAARWRVPLRLVHVMNLSAFSFGAGQVAPADYLAGVQAAGRARLAHVRGEVRRAHPDLEVASEVLDGDTVTELVGESERAGMVVLGSRASARFAGSLAVALAAHGHSPVAVVPGDELGRVLPATGPVVVGVDGSPASDLAVAIAFDQASVRRADVVAVHAWVEFGSDTERACASGYDLDWDAMRSREHELLAQRLAGWQEKYPDVLIRPVVTRDRPARCLLEQADSAQLLVAGSRGRGVFRSLLLGSTTRWLIQHTPCPLIVARPLDK